MPLSKRDSARFRCRCLRKRSGAPAPRGWCASRCACAAGSRATISPMPANRKLDQATLAARRTFGGRRASPRAHSLE